MRVQSQTFELAAPIEDLVKSSKIRSAQEGGGGVAGSNNKEFPCVTAIKRLESIGQQTTFFKRVSPPASHLKTLWKRNMFLKEFHSKV